MNAKVEAFMQILSSTSAYRLAMTGAIVSALLLIWLSLGVGIIGQDGDPANRMYFAVVAVGIIGALVARLHARGMSRTLFAMAIVQALIAAFALITHLGLPWSGPAELVLLNGFFVAAFTISALLFRRAAAVHGG
jgi:hypothetical protein